MFRAVKAIGGLDVQLVYFRGAGECRSSKWVSDPDALSALMTKVACAGGYTQIRKVLSHARAEAARKPVNALVYVGDWPLSICSSHSACTSGRRRALCAPPTTRRRPSGSASYR
jgi:hypothetical protein